MTTLSSTLGVDKHKIAQIISSDSWMNDLKNHKGQAKCSTTSTDLRKQGNEIYLNSKHDASVHEEAWKMYTKSIALAPHGSEELALAFGNRSAVLRHLCEYEACVEDVARATKITSSDHLKAKLLIRKVQCLAVLKKYTLKSTVTSVNELIGRLTLDKDAKKKLKTNLKEAAAAEDANLSRAMQLKIPSFRSSKEIPCASNACAISHDKKYGRHLIATRDIKTGEILVDEKPYIMVPFTTKFFYCCWNCLKIAWASIPCDSCAYAMFCSEFCKKEAETNYHDIECPILEYIWNMQGLNFGVSQFSSLRMTVRAIREFGGIPNLREIIKAWDDNCDDACTNGFSDGVFHSDSYKSIYSLSVQLQNTTDKFREAAMILCMLAKHTLLFGDAFRTDPKAIATDSDALFVGALICRNAHILSVNSHESAIVRAYVNKPAMSRQPQSPEDVLYDDSLGQIVLSLCSLINHSCTPNVTRCSTGNQRVVIYATRPIKKGEQIFDCYGFTHCSETKDMRQNYLKLKYDFICDCIACKEDWPLKADLPKLSTCVRSEVDWNEIQNVLEKSQITAAVRGTVHFNVKDFLQDICKFIELLAKYTSKPNVEIIQNTASLINIFDGLYGAKFSFPTEC